MPAKAPLILALGFCVSSTTADAEDFAPLSEGELSLSVTLGQREEVHRYRIKDGQMRIDRPGESIPSPPVNLVDLRSGRVTILRPHNGTARSFTPSDAPPAGKLPGGEAPEMPALPEHPPQAQKDVIPGPSAMSAVPGRPNTATFTLEAMEATRKIHGFPCRKHTLELPREGTLTLWLTKEKRLFPFHTLRYEGPRRFGREAWPEQVASLLRQKQRFPLLLTLKESTDEEKQTTAELARWEVTSVQRSPLEVSEEDLFAVPDSFHSLDR